MARKKPARGRGTPARKPLRRRPATPAPVFYPPSVAIGRAIQIRAQEALQSDYLRAYERAKQNIEIADRLRELRRYVKGFEAANRYDLREIDSWTDAKRELVIESSKRLRYLTSRPHVTVRVPRNRKHKASLKRLTRQDPRELKQFIVHTEQPERTTIRFSKRGNVQIHVKDGSKRGSTRELWLWEDFNEGEHPATLNEQRKVLETMLPRMPNGYYSFWTWLHGQIGVPYHKRSLRSKLQEWYHAYEVGQFAYLHKGFGQVLSGLIYLGSWAKARKVQRLAANQRNKYQQEKQFRIVKRREHQKGIAREVYRRFQKKADQLARDRCAHRNRQGLRCKLPVRHRGRHRFK